jgi:ketosteroid isomerase-like protein
MSNPDRGRSATRRTALLLTVLLALACSQQPGEPPSNRAAVTATDHQALFDAHGELIRAYERADADAFAALLDTSSELLIFHPRLQSRFGGVTAARENLGLMFSRLNETAWTEAHPALVVKGDVAWLTYNVIIESPRLDPPFVGRGTEVWVRSRGNWRLAHGHWSADVAAVEPATGRS